MFGGGGGFGQTQSTTQGYIKPVYGIDIALKKEFLKNNAASLTLQFSDIFRTRVSAIKPNPNAFMMNLLIRARIETKFLNGRSADWEIAG